MDHITKTKIDKTDFNTRCSYQLFPWKTTKNDQNNNNLCENPLKFWQFDSISMTTPDGKAAWLHKID